MKNEERAEQYGRRVFPSMTLNRRISTMAYFVWLVGEGLYSSVHQARLKGSGVSGMEISIMYWVGSGLLVAFLHSYVGGTFAIYSFQLATLVHQTSLIALSIWKLANLNVDHDQIWLGFRSALLWYCATGEASVAALQIGEVLSQTLVEDKASDNELDISW
jgi:hypothetical protein